MGMSGKGRVVVAVPTLGARPIKPLLSQLAAQPATGANVTVVVVHNGPDGRHAAEVASKEFDAEFAHLPEAGFSRARNFALDRARTADVLIFIDDDELPSPHWLNEHLRSLQRWRADVSFGPVVVRADSPTPKWFGDGQLLRPRILREDGPTSSDVYSGNTALDMSSPRVSDLRFDPAFDKTGGEDTDFFRRMRRRGARIVWTSQAVVAETPDIDRLSIRGVLRRAFDTARRNAATRALPSWRRTTTMAIRKMVQLTLGSLLVVGGLLSADSHRAVRGLRHIALASGTLRGLYDGASAQPASHPGLGVEESTTEQH
jgi:succinoglycan biosynthesis protein ExoM